MKNYLNKYLLTNSTYKRLVFLKTQLLSPFLSKSKTLDYCNLSV